jgi:hypothetical protein
MKAQSTIIRHLGWLAGLLLLACLPSCMIELDGGRKIDSPLMVQPSVSGSQQTKVTVPDDSSQKEDDLITLDVFVKGAETTNADFWKSYHLKVDPDNLQAEVDNLLSRNWREDLDDSQTLHYVEGAKYDVYAVANSDLTASVSSFEALKAIKDNEFTAACVWDDGTINPAELNLHKTYVAGFDPSAAGVTGQNRRAMTNHKKFVMDGVVKNWSPVGGMQVIPMTLERAASKFEVNVSFADSLLRAFEAQGKSVVGQPGWRFVNFAFDAPVINPEHYGSTATDADHVLTAGSLLLGNASYGDRQDCYRFQINTYSYPHVWAVSDAVNQAPALVISVGIDDGTSTTYTYYRIPLIDQTTTTSIGRNMLYRVNAMIEGSGSTSLDDLTGMIVDYEVIPWNDPLHSGTQPAPVEYNERLYLQVTPHTYTLRGDGTQTVDLTYMLPTGKHVKIQYFTTQANNEAIAKGNDVGNSGTAAYTAGSPAAWYYNKSGTYRTLFESTAIAGNVQVSINDNNANDDVNKGTITVSSNSLPNKAIKHIAFRVYLDVPNWYSKGLYRDIYIRHFPTDNIQGIPGSWSSRWSPNYEYTFDLATAQSWGIFSVEEIEVSSTDPYDRVGEGIEWTSSNQSTFRSNVPSNARGTMYTKDYPYQGSNGYYYCGEAFTPSLNNYQNYRSNNDRSNNYDYYEYGVGGYSYYFYYNYSAYYRGQLATKYYRTRYYRINNTATPSTGNWVDWDRDANQTYSSSTAKYTYDGSNFEAKVGYNGLVYPMNVSTNYRYTRHTSQNSEHGVVRSTDGQRTTRNSNMSNLNNTYMYVIQISETNPTYKLGRPELDGLYQTDDHVVSPAFMIASQLGAVSSFGSSPQGGRNAAAHCNSYMEVGTNGTRYVGWRLPTEEEIDVIIKYQGTSQNSVIIDGVTINNTNDRVLTPVLTGGYYWTCNNRTTPKSTGWNDDNVAVRCIRDLSPEEVEELNSTGAITQ